MLGVPICAHRRDRAVTARELELCVALPGLEDGEGFIHPSSIQGGFGDLEM